jgi:hypothetical protein
MGVFTRSYFGQPGATAITDYNLVFVEILRVSRNNGVRYEVDGTPASGSLEFQYIPGSGTIQFDPDNPFLGATVGRPNRFSLERVQVKYRI